MRELAEALKKRAGLRMRQGVVTAVDGSTNSVLIGGSTVAVDGVQHLNSCSPVVDDVVWITSDGADLWIVGTHGDPPPIDPSRLPAFETYFAGADPAGDPNPVIGLEGVAAMTGVMLSWDLPAEALWRTWEVYEGTSPGFSPDTPILSTMSTVVTIAHDPASGPWYYKVRAINSRSEASADVEVGPFSLPALPAGDVADGSITAVKIADDAIETPKLAANAVTAAKINVADVQAAVVTAGAVNALALDAGAILAGTIDTARLNAAEIQAAVVTAAAINALMLNAVMITGGTITGATLQTAPSGARVQLSSAPGVYTGISLYSGDGDQHGWIEGQSVTGGSQLVLQGANFGGGVSWINLVDTATQSRIELNAGDGLSSITIGDPAVPGRITLGSTTVRVSGNLNVDGRVYPQTDWVSGTSDDGVWIQDYYAKTKRVKLYFNSSNNRFGVFDDAGNSHYVMLTA